MARNDVYDCATPGCKLKTPMEYRDIAVSANGINTVVSIGFPPMNGWTWVKVHRNIYRLHCPAHVADAKAAAGLAAIKNMTGKQPVKLHNYRVVRGTR